MEKILVAVDLELGIQNVMSETRKYAKALGASVVLVDLEPLLSGAGGIEDEEGALGLESDYGDEIRTIRDLGADLTSAGIENRVLIIEGNAADELVKEAVREAPSLIVMASARHGALVEALTHGLREQIARRVSCPLLLVPRD
jgi:nucleotide-binding universal stress UspA family protein